MVIRSGGDRRVPPPRLEGDRLERQRYGDRDRARVERAQRVRRRRAVGRVADGRPRRRRRDGDVDRTGIGPGAGRERRSRGLGPDQVLARGHDGGRPARPIGDGPQVQAFRDMDGARVHRPARRGGRRTVGRIADLSARGRRRHGDVLGDHKGPRPRAEDRSGNKGFDRILPRGHGGGRPPCAEGHRLEGESGIDMDGGRVGGPGRGRRLGAVGRVAYRRVRRRGRDRDVDGRGVCPGLRAQQRGGDRARLRLFVRGDASEGNEEQQTQPESGVRNPLLHLALCRHHNPDVQGLSKGASCPRSGRRLAPNIALT